MSPGHPLVEAGLSCPGTARNLACSVTSAHCSMSSPRSSLALCLFWLRWVFIGAHRLSPVAVSGLSFPASRGVLDPGPVIEPAPLHWRVDSSPLDRQGVLSVLVLNLGDGYLAVVSYSLRYNGLAKMVVQVFP